MPKLTCPNCGTQISPQHLLHYPYRGTVGERIADLLSDSVMDQRWWTARELSERLHAPYHTVRTALRALDAHDLLLRRKPGGGYHNTSPYQYRWHE